jgi:cobalt-zinc-cadmium efflux system outer membrane protein
MIMIFTLGGSCAQLLRFLAPALLMLGWVIATPAQTLPNSHLVSNDAPGNPLKTSAPVVSATVGHYFDPVQGATSAEMVQRALATNGELAAARLDIERARARLRQAGLRPNPTIDFEQTTGRLTGSAGERETGIGVSLPLEVGGQRRSRIDVAQAELEATEAEVADRERRLAGDVLAAYAEALSALRELEITEGLNDLDLQTTKFVQVRVNEGETAPIELSLLQVEVDRLRSRRALVEGRLQAALIRVRSLAGMPLNEDGEHDDDAPTFGYAPAFGRAQSGIHQLRGDSRPRRHPGPAVLAPGAERREAEGERGGICAR